MIPIPHQHKRRPEDRVGGCCRVGQGELGPPERLGATDGRGLGHLGEQAVVKATVGREATAQWDTRRVPRSGVEEGPRQARETLAAERPSGPAVLQAERTTQSASRRNWGDVAGVEEAVVRGARRGRWGQGQCRLG